MNYNEALEYIHSISWTFCKPGLERISELCSMLADPQNDLKFIHVVGTNGKGSTSAMLDSTLRAAGYRVGLYTSPYIVRFNERIRFGGESITDDELAEITSYVRPFADSMQDKPTEFELITAIAFEYFKRKGCDVVVFEAGMGGRLDSTNVIPPPLATVITNVALDHTAFLGDTVPKIAAEKAGVIKRGSRVIYGGDVTDEAYPVIKAAATVAGAPLTLPDYSSVRIKKADLNGTSFSYLDLESVNISLLGSYQPYNAALAITVLSELESVGINVPRVKLLEGLATARWRARFEIIRKEPLVIFDGAHNPHGIRAAVKSIKAYFGRKKVVLLSGILADKDYDFVAGELSTVASFAYTVTPDNPRALSASDYAAALRKKGTPSRPTKGISEALSLAIERARKEGRAVVCLGSLYTYGDVIGALEKIDSEG